MCEECLCTCLLISIWLLQYTYQEEVQSFFYIGLLIALSSIVIGWVLGGNSDKARDYYQDLLINKEELQKKTEDLQQIFDSIDATICSNDVVEQRIYVSKGIGKLTGYTVEQFYDDYSFWTSILHTEDRQKGFEFYDKVLNGYSDETELRFINVHGEYIWVYIRCTDFRG
jgi:PAS domain S-box-containing protein